MQQPLIFLAILSSITLIFSKGIIFDAPKQWIIIHVPDYMEWFLSNLFECSMCSGFWIGMIGSFVLSPAWIGYGCPFNHFFAGCLVSVLSRAIDIAMWGRNE